MKKFKRPKKLKKVKIHVRPHAVQDMAECGCGRITGVDMFVVYDGEEICDGCWTALRRQGLLEESKMNMRRLPS